MAGFRSPLFLLGLSSGTAQAGFRGPLPLPPIAGGGGVITQAGFRGPLPLPPIAGGIPSIAQAGFIGPIPILNLGAGEPIVPHVVPPTEGGGMGLSSRFHPGHTDRTAFGDDDEVLMMVIRQFLERVK